MEQSRTVATIRFNGDTIYQSSFYCSTTASDLAEEKFRAAFRIELAAALATSVRGLTEWLCDIPPGRTIRVDKMKNR